mgnify:CR=1 FL=1
MNTSFEIIRSAGTDHLCYRVKNDTFVAVHNQMLSFTEMEDEFEIVPTDKSYRDKLYIYQGQAVRLVPQIYRNGWLALCLELADTEEPYTILTVNLEETDAIGLPDKAFIDINNNPDAMEFLIANKLAEDTGYKRQSGWVDYPMVKLNMPSLYRLDPAGFHKIISCQQINH